MPTSTSSSWTELPGPVTDALADIESGLPADATDDDPDRRTLVRDVAAYLDPRVHHPLTRALLARPGILAFCVRAAVQAEPGQGGFSSVSVRRSPPLGEGEESSDAEKPSPGPARRRTKGSES